MPERSPFETYFYKTYDDELCIRVSNVIDVPFIEIKDSNCSFNQVNLIVSDQGGSSQNQPIEFSGKFLRSLIKEFDVDCFNIQQEYSANVDLSSILDESFVKWLNEKQYFAFRSLEGNEIILRR